MDIEKIYKKAVIPCFNLARTCIKEKVPMAFNSLLELEEKNDPDIYKYIAACYLNGYGVGKNIESVYEIYSKLAKLGDAKSMKVLGDYYSGKIEGGTQVDVSLAAHWYFEAAKNTPGNHIECYPRALYKLLSIDELSDQDLMAILRYCGECAENGYGCRKDMMLAAAAYKRAVNLGDEISKNYLQKRALRQQTICNLISRFSADPKF